MGSIEPLLLVDLVLLHPLALYFVRLLSPATVKMESPYRAASVDFGGGYGQQAAARLPVRVKYLLSSQWSAAATLLHFFCLEIKRGAFGVPTMRVIAITDERGFDADFDGAQQRCINFSRVEALALLPRDMHFLEGKTVSSSAPNMATGLNGDQGRSILDQQRHLEEELSIPVTPQHNDVDLYLQQSDAKDFMRMLGALYKPNLSGGSPPLFEVEEGQPLGGNKINCRLRAAPLRTPIVDGISKEALKALTEEHTRQIKVFREKFEKEKMEDTSDRADQFAQRDALRARILQLEGQLQAQETQARNDRDRMRLQMAQLQEDLHRSREEIKTLKLLRAGVVQPDGRPSPPPAAPYETLVSSSPLNSTATKSHALQRLQQEVRESENFLENMRSNSTASGSTAYSRPPVNQSYQQGSPAQAWSQQHGAPSGIRPSDSYQSSYQPQHSSSQSQGHFRY